MAAPWAAEVNERHLQAIASVSGWGLGLLIQQPQSEKKKAAVVEAPFRPLPYMQHLKALKLALEQDLQPYLFAVKVAGLLTLVVEHQLPTI